MKNSIKGLSLSGVIALLAFISSFFIPLGSVTLAIIIGVIVGNLIQFDHSYDSGITYAEKTLLAYAIALMGIELDFNILAALGLKTIMIIVVGMVATIWLSVYIGKYLHLDKKFALLLGIGNGVCGASAISATAPIINTQKSFIGISIAIVNLLGTIGIFFVPFIAFVFGLNEIEAGILVGNTLQAVGQVTAGGFSISETAGVSATAVKMGRVLLLTPLVFILLYIFHAKNSDENTKGAKVPGFIIVFVLMSLVSSFGLVSEPLKNIISNTSELFLLLAMAAIGLKIHFSSIKSDGQLAFKVASIVFILQIILTLVLLLAF